MKKILLRAVLCLTVLAMLLASVSCSGRGKTLLSLEKDGIEVSISVNAFELLMARQKATLSEIQNVGNDSFWDTYTGDPVKTMDDFYRDSILENCKTYLVILYLFEKEGLSLTDAELKGVEDTMEEFIKTDGDGSKSKLNAVLSDYGVNYNILKDVYLMMAKIEAYQNHISSRVGDDIKTKYMETNYVHYNQIYLPFQKFVYETNESGEKVKATNEDGSYKMVDMTDAEKAVLKTEKDIYLKELRGATPESFVQYTEEVVYKEKDFGKDENTDGYYIRRANYTGARSYLNAVIAACDSINNGDITEIETDFGYFIIQKDAFTEKAYDHEANKSGWFEDFDSLVTNQVINELCQPHLSAVAVDMDVYAQAPSMKEVKKCYFY